MAEKKLVKYFLDMEAAGSQDDPVDLCSDEEEITAEDAKFIDDEEPTDYVPDSPRTPPAMDIEEDVPPTQPHDWEAEDPGDAKDAGFGNIMPEAQNRGGPFRLNAKQIFLTYPQADTLPYKLEAVDIIKKAQEKGDLVEYYVGKEFHKDGHVHFHAYIRYGSKKNIRSATSYDIQGYHPNIQGVKDKKSVLTYVCKSGNILRSDVLFDWSNPVNFRKRQQDVDAYTEALEHKRLEPIRWPILLPDGTYANRPLRTDRKRHWWITGAPGLGKTRWAQVTFRNTQVFSPIGASPYPFEGYAGEDAILFDDWESIKLTKAMLTNVCNVYFIKTHVWGPVRYNRCYWPIDQARTVFIISNDEPPTDQWFTDRFFIIRCDDEIRVAGQEEL